MTKLIIIYGSEASGKLTIARELTAQTNLKLFHNHISIDVAKALFELGEKPFNELVWKVRLVAFESAAQNNLPGIVFTWAYSHPDFQPLLDTLLATIAPYDVEVHFVFVKCSQTELEKRVISEDRRKADKAHSIEDLHRQQRVKNHVEIPGTRSLIVDSTSLSPLKAAHMIINRFALEEYLKPQV